MAVMTHAPLQLWGTQRMRTRCSIAVGAEMAIAQMTGQLFLVEATVKRHMPSIILKLGARKRVAAALARLPK